MKQEMVLGRRVCVAMTFFERARGLIGRPPPPPGEGLLIPKCNCVHTFFMRYPIDIVFLDEANHPVKTVRHVRPWRLWVWGGWRARKALEFSSEKR